MTQTNARRDPARRAQPRSDGRKGAGATTTSPPSSEPVERHSAVDARTARVGCSTCETYWDARAAVIAAAIIARTGGGPAGVLLALRYRRRVHRRHAIYGLPLTYPNPDSHEWLGTDR